MNGVARRGAGLAVGVLLAACVASAPADAAQFSVASPTALQASDATCSPCRTIQGAVRRAGINPGHDIIQLGVGTYVENVIISDQDTLVMNGRGAATKIRGRITIGLPARDRNGRPVAPAGFFRTVGFGLMVIESDGVALTTSKVAVDLSSVAVIGSIQVRSASIDLRNTSVYSSGCGAAIALSGSSTYTDPETGNELYNDLRASRTIVSGAAAVVADDSIGVIYNASLAVARSAANCQQTAAIKATGADTHVNLYGAAIIAEGSAPTWGIRQAGGAGLYNSVTISGAFKGGLQVINDGFARIEATAIDVSTPFAIDELGAFSLNARPGAAMLTWVYSSGMAQRRAGQPALGDTNHLSIPLALGPYGYPTAASPLLDAITDNTGQRQVFFGDRGGCNAGCGQRPVPAITGRPALFDVGGWERPTDAIIDAPSGMGWGPSWLNPQLQVGGIVVDLAGLGFPVNPEVQLPAAGDAAAPAIEPGDEAAAEAAAVAVESALEVTAPPRVRQGATIVVRVKVPYRGRIAVRVYGQRGKLIAVGRGRPVTRGWRRVKIKLGPHARVGRMSIFVSHNANGRPQLTGTCMSRIAKRGGTSGVAARLPAVGRLPPIGA